MKAMPDVSVFAFVLYHSDAQMSGIYPLDRGQITAQQSVPARRYFIYFFVYELVKQGESMFLMHSIGIRPSSVSAFTKT